VAQFVEKSYRINETSQKLKGANMDIDLASPQGSIAWEQAGCPWNEAEGTDIHKYAVKNVSICRYFCGVEYIDTVLCCYPKQNPLRQAG